MSESNKIEILSEQLKYEVSKLENTKLLEYLRYELELTDLRHKILFLLDKIPLINLKIMMKKTIEEIENSTENLLDFCLDLDSNLNTTKSHILTLKNKLDKLLFEVDSKCKEIHYPLYSLIVDSGDGLECDLFDINDIKEDFDELQNELQTIYDFQLSCNNNDIDSYLRNINVSNPDSDTDTNTDSDIENKFLSDNDQSENENDESDNDQTENDLSESDNDTCIEYLIDN